MGFVINADHVNQLLAAKFMAVVPMLTGYKALVAMIVPAPNNREKL